MFNRCQQIINRQGERESGTEIPAKYLAYNALPYPSTALPATALNQVGLRKINWDLHRGYHALAVLVLPPITINRSNIYVIVSDNTNNGAIRI
jgi:hypothetical protein